jgi:glycosyltransferase involved in cell wall biosynthesis
MELGVPDNAPVVGAIGNLYPVKGHIHLVKAFARVTEQVPDGRLVVAGRGELLEDLKNETLRLGITKQVMFLGFREDVSSLLQAFDIFVMPSESEGIPLSLLEAMACSKPVVVTNVGGMPEVVTDKVGLRCQPRDPVALADNILALLRDPVLCNRMAQTARERVEVEFSLERMSRQYSYCYDMLKSCTQGQRTRNSMSL